MSICGYIKTMVVGIALVMTAGCLFLPVPHYREHMLECSGQVVDAKTDKPVPGAEVTVKRGRYREKVSCDRNGHFHVDATGGWHWMYFIATPSSGSLFPTHLYPQDEWPVTYLVEANGYTGGTFRLSSVCLSKDGMATYESPTNSILPIKKRGEHHEHQ